MTHDPKHILGAFDEALASFDNDLVMMGSLAERGLRNAMEGLRNRDDALCNQTIADDEEIDFLEKQVDKQGIDLLRRFQPVAKDLRQIVAGMKVSGNLERIADQGVNIAKEARKLNRKPLMEEVSLLDRLFDGAMQLLSEARRAYCEGDLELARSLSAKDKELDAIDRDITHHLTNAMARNPGKTLDYLSLIFISRHLERVGDHAKNIAEEAVYAFAAEDIRHPQAEKA